MRSRMRRRSVSSLVSPGPRVPMPPPSRDSAADAPTSRGNRYRNCASSTCSLPSRVRARRAKMSRMSWVRSMTRRCRIFSMLRSCAGDSSLSKMTNDSCDSSQAAFNVSSLPEPMSVAGSGRSRSCVNRITGSMSAASASPASSSSASSTCVRRAAPVISPTSAARSRPSEPRSCPSKSVTEGMLAPRSGGDRDLHRTRLQHVGEHVRRHADEQAARAAVDVDARQRQDAALHISRQWLTRAER